MATKRYTAIIFVIQRESHVFVLKNKAESGTFPAKINRNLCFS